MGHLVIMPLYRCKIMLRLPPSSLGLAQDTKLAESSPSSSCAECVESRGPRSKSSSLSSGVVPSTAAVAAAEKNQFHYHNHQQTRSISSGSAARRLAQSQVTEA